MQEAIKLLRQDLDNQMATGKPSPDLFDETVIFRDPITKVDGLKNYTDIIGLFLVNVVASTGSLSHLNTSSFHACLPDWQNAIDRED